MRYLSLFSGIEAASVAWGPLGWEATAFAEIDPFPCAVLAHHYPNVPNLGDVTKADYDSVGPVDLIVFGSPCQSFSVAGKRLGLADPRGNLALHALSVVNRLRPRWFLFENVPGLLSSGAGRDFGQFLATVGECGYQCAWRVLDARFFGVPQRRRRVFVVGHLGDWRPAAAVLFEPESLCRDLTPSREAGARAAGCLASRTSAGGGLGTDMELDGGLIAHSLRADGFDASEDGTGRGTPLVPVAFSCKDHGADAGDTSPTLRAMGRDGSHANAGGQIAVDQPYTLAIRGRDDTHRLEYRQDGLANAILTPNGGRAGIGVGAVAFQQNTRDELRYIGGDGQIAGALAAEAGMKQQNYLLQPYNIIGCGQKGRNHAYEARVSGCLQHKGLAATGNEAGTLVRQTMAVRRLTPRECERLQGFPDDYTLVPYRGKPAADGPRYKALGNSMAVPVMSWVGQRVQLIEENMHGTKP
jgi:DNA (cytosine-5)-methyltransferase 1